MKSALFPRTQYGFAAAFDHALRDSTRFDEIRRDSTPPYSFKLIRLHANLHNRSGSKKQPETGPKIHQIIRGIHKTYPQFMIKVKVGKVTCQNWFIFAVLFRARSSVGSEHLVYTQGVRGSNPFAPTEKNSTLNR